MTEVRRNSFVSRHLDPGSHMLEILFGLIMTLTFTLAAGMVIEDEGAAGARAMLLGILGCNLAWGIIDGVFYVLGELFERGRLRRLAITVRQATSDAAAQRMVADEVDETFAQLADESARQRLYAAILERARSAPPAAPNPVRRDDLLGGLAAGLVVFGCSIPAVLPFVFLDDPHLALRISNSILLALLFLVGWRAAQHTMANPWIAGSVFLLAGVLLVAITILLGG